MENFKEFFAFIKDIEKKAKSDFERQKQSIIKLHNEQLQLMERDIIDFKERLEGELNKELANYRVQLNQKIEAIHRNAEQTRLKIGKVITEKRELIFQELINKVWQLPL